MPDNPIPADLTAFPHWQKLVDSRPDYRRLWLKGLFPPPESISQLPRVVKGIEHTVELPKDIMSQSKRYLHERAIWQELGKPIRDAKTIEHIFSDICQPCEYFDKKSDKLGRCKICMCYLKPKGVAFNKLAWATTSCPANPPKWKTNIFQVVNKDQAEVEQEIEQEQQLWQEQAEKQANGLKMREEPISRPVSKPNRKMGCCGK